MLQLTPREKALLQVSESLGMSAGLSSIVAVSVVLAGAGHINWIALAAFAGGTFVISLLHGASAYIKAASSKQPDPTTAVQEETLSTAVETILDEMQIRFPLPSPVSPQIRNVPISTLDQVDANKHRTVPLDPA